MPRVGSLKRSPGLFVRWIAGVRPNWGNSPVAAVAPLRWPASILSGSRGSIDHDALDHAFPTVHVALARRRRDPGAVLWAEDLAGCGRGLPAAARAALAAGPEGRRQDAG